MAVHLEMFQGLEVNSERHLSFSAVVFHAYVFKQTAFQPCYPGLDLGLVGQVHPVRAASYTYTATPAGNITDTGIIPDNACGATGWPNTRYFLVNDHFSVTDLNVRFTAAHISRGQIQVILTSSPDASGVSVSQTIVATSGDTDDNYDILLDGDAGGALDDNSADSTADPVDRSVSQPLLNNFDGRDARGAWRMDICDNSSTTTGSLVSASLFFTGNPITITPPTFTQGPAILETYFIPYPEDQLWTAMGTLYYPGRAAAIGDTTNAAACTDYSTFNANPRQPIIGYTGVTTSEGGTIVYYDHWEDGYELALSFPSQTTTEVWGDGILTNGRAPGDADDVLTAGQLITLSDVKNTTQAEVIDYDARDKLGATEPIAVTRSAWANGSNTLFAAGDEVYPTYMWGSDYRLPLGEITNTTYDYFQYTGVLILAAEDGTVVYIDRDNNGTPEMTCNLNQGGVCQWDDKSDASGIMGVNDVIGNGLIAGSHIYNSDGKKFQVSLLTGDVCAGYETRSYTLLPTDRWSNQYYAPVSSSLSSRTIGTSTQTMPTVVTLYNPGTSALTVNWTFGTGTTGSQAIGANAFFSVTIPNNTATLKGLIGKYTSGTPLITVYLNQGVEPIFSGFLSNLTEYNLEIYFDQSLLVEGTNTFRIETDSNNIVLINWLELTYQDTYIAENDRLKFTFIDPGDWEVNVNGFSQGEIEILDLTNPTHPLMIINGEITTAGSDYSIRFDYAGDGNPVFLAQTLSHPIMPMSIQQDTPSYLRSTENGADYLIITCSDFYSAVQPLKTYRESTGYRVQIVDVQDIYDEFNWGIENPEAIKTFITYAYNNWVQPGVSYVLLFGDGTYDFQNYSSSGDRNFVPPYLDEIDPWIGETSTDNRYANISGDDILPDLFIGRLPARR